MCFTCWLRSGFSHFRYMDSLSFTWYLVAAESRISKQSGVQDALQNSELCRCLKTFEDLSESKCRLVKVRNLFNVKDAVPVGLRTRVVYKFSCASCNACYVGETSRH